MPFNTDCRDTQNWYIIVPLLQKDMYVYIFICWGKYAKNPTIYLFPFLFFVLCVGSITYLCNSLSIFVYLSMSRFHQYSWWYSGNLGMSKLSTFTDISCITIIVIVIVIVYPAYSLFFLSSICGLNGFFIHEPVKYCLFFKIFFSLKKIPQFD